MSSSYQAHNEKDTVLLPRVRKGYALSWLYVLLAPWVPILLIMTFIKANNSQAILPTFIASAFILVVVWAGIIVQCITEMTRYASNSAASGLFIVLISPVIWFMFSYGIFLLNLGDIQSTINNMFFNNMLG